MIITGLKKAIGISNRDLEILRSKKIKIEEAMVIHFNTGLVWTKPVLVNGDQYSDLSYIIDDIYNNDNTLLPLYTLAEALDIIGQSYEEWEQGSILFDENFSYVNGGEFFTDTISHIDFL